MGFSVTAATAIVVAGLLYNGSILVGSHFNAQQEIQQAARATEVHRADLRQGLIQVDNVTFDGSGQSLRVNVTNAGSVTYNTSKMDLLVDGSVRTAAITSRTVNDQPTNVWPPDTRLEIIVPQASAPSYVVVVAPTGTMDFWRA